MIIEKIHIDAFGKLHNFDLTFDPNMNIIEGNNESGKSTLAAFLRFMLYGFSQESFDGISEREKRLPWSGDRAQGSMVVRTKEGHYEIRRTSSSNAEEDSCQVINLNTGTEENFADTFGDTIFGVTSDMFANTAFVGQMNHNMVGGQAIAEAIENILYSGDERVNVAKSAENLTDEMNHIMAPDEESGELDFARHKLEQLEKQLEDVKSKQQSFLEKKMTYADYIGKKSDSEIAKENYEKKDHDYKNAMIIKSFDYLKDETDSRDACIKERDHLDDTRRNGDFLPTKQTYSDLLLCAEEGNKRYAQYKENERNYHESEQRAKLTESDAKMISMCRAHGGNQAVVSHGKELRKKQNLFLLLGSSLLLLVLAFLIVEIMEHSLSTLFQSASLPYIILGIAFIGAGVLFYFFTNYRKKLLQLCEDYGTVNFPQFRLYLHQLYLKENESAKLMAIAEEDHKKFIRSKDDFVDFRDHCAKFLLKLKHSLNDEASLSEEILAVATEVRAYLDKRDEIEANINKHNATIKELQKNLARFDEEKMRGTLDESEVRELMKIDHDKLLEAIDQAGRMAIFYKEKAEEEQKLILAEASSLEDITALEMAVMDEKNKIQSLVNYHSACLLAKDAITSIGERMHREIAPRLSIDAGRVLKIITSGKYNYLSVSENIELRFVDNQQVRDTAYLSAGTQDAAYLSLRIALVDMLYSEMPPICFDESFAHQDDVRAKGLVDALYELSREGKQIFIYTCHGREAKIAADSCGGFLHVNF